MEFKFKNKIREARKEKKMSQLQLADMIGTTRQTIISIEKEQFSPSARLALLICVALDKNFEELFYFSY